MTDNADFVASAPPPVAVKKRRFRWWLLLLIMALLAMLAVALVAVVYMTDLGGARTALWRWVGMRSLYKAGANETLVHIITFEGSEWPTLQTEKTLQQAFERSANELGLAHLRVQIDPRSIAVNDTQAARIPAQEYGADLVVWGRTVSNVAEVYLFVPDAAKAREVCTQPNICWTIISPEVVSLLVADDLTSQANVVAPTAIARMYLLRGDAFKSIGALNQATALTPAEAKGSLWAEVFGTLGVARQMADDDPALAIDAYSRAIAARPDNIIAYANRGIAFMAQDDWAHAIADFDQAIAVWPYYSGEIYDARATAYAMQGDLDHALSDYTHAIELAPDADSYGGRGYVYQQLGDAVHAIADYDQAIAFGSVPGSVYLNRGLSYIMLGDSDRAIADLDRAIEMDPTLALAYMSRGLLYYAQHNPNQALADLTRAIELDPSSAETYAVRGTVYGERGDLTRALDDFVRATTLDPQNDKAFYGLGVTYMQQEDCVRAIDAFSRALKNNPKSVEALAERSTCYQQQGDYAHAVADLNQAITLRPNDPVLYYNRGNTYQLLKDLLKAEADYSYALALYDDFAPAYLNRGIVRTLRKDYQGAISDFGQAIELDPRASGAEALLYRGRTHFLLNEYAQAVVDFTSYVTSCKSDEFEPFYWRGMAYARLKQKDKAISDFRLARTLAKDATQRADAEKRLKELGAK